MGLKTERAKLIAAFAAIYFIWGSTYLGIRFAVETLPPILMAGVRSFTAGAMLYAVCRARGAARPPARHWKSAAVAGLGLLWAGNGLVTLAEKTVPSGVAALIVATVPFWMALFQTALDRNAMPGKRAWGGVLMGLAGVGVLTGFGGGGQVGPAGFALVLGAALAWAAGSVYRRRADLPADAVLSAAMQMLAGGGALLATSLVWGEAAGFVPSAVSARSAWSLAYLIVMGSVVGFTCYGWLLKNASPVAVSTYAYVNPAVAVGLGVWLGGESLSGQTLAAGALILAGVVLMTSAPPGRRKDG